MMQKRYSSLQELANHEVWPHCAEGMGVDGDEVTQELVLQGKVSWTPEGIRLNISREQVQEYVTDVYQSRGY